jgi:heme/copper-type cytochrome/quinol oxidase subunit 1
MPRRIPDYPDAFAHWNAIASFGSYMNLFGSIFFFFLIASAFTNKIKPLTAITSKVV